MTRTSSVPEFGGSEQRVFQREDKQMKYFLTSLLLLANFRNEQKNVPEPLYLTANDFWLRKCDPPFGQ